MTIYKVKAAEAKSVVDLLSEKALLSKMDIKRLIQFGAVWVHFKNKKRRLRRNDYELNENEHAVLHFDAKILEQIKNKKMDNPPMELFNFRTWGIWYKPVGFLSQGSPFGDQWSVERYAQKQYKSSFLINRLDIEVSGLIVLAYTKESASDLNKIWNEHNLKKFYLAKVLGEIKVSDWETISTEVEGRPSETKYRTLKAEDGISCLEVELITGRKHQIRIHLDSIGHPIMGDPRYGRKNKNEEGLQLQSYKLVLKGPGMAKEQTFLLPEHLLLFKI